MEVFFAFVQDAQFDGGRTLNWAVLDDVPELQKYFKGVEFIGERKDIEQFIQNIHSKNELQMTDKLDKYQEKWQKMHAEFFKLTADIFADQDWPRGKYIAYITIWKMFPRFLEDKTFCLPYTGKMCASSNEICAHELLHFIFYDYFWTKYPEYAKEGQEMFTWHVSEIFNTTVQNSNTWLSVFPQGNMGYPEHKQIVINSQKKYPEITNSNLTGFVNDIVKEVKVLMN